MVLFFIVRVCARWWKAVWTLGAIAVRRTGERGQSYDEFFALLAALQRQDGFRRTALW